MTINVLTRDYDRALVVLVYTIMHATETVHTFFVRYYSFVE